MPFTSLNTSHYLPQVSLKNINSGYHDELYWSWQSSTKQGLFGSYVEKIELVYLIKNTYGHVIGVTNHTYQLNLFGHVKQCVSKFKLTTLGKEYGVKFHYNNGDYDSLILKDNNY